MYDYVIVGGGSAGCVLANRLSENETTEVLLLESGSAADREAMSEAIADPSRVYDLLGSRVDWQFAVEPQPGLNGRRIEWPRGKSLGGSSLINGMAYVRGHPWDFDHWAALGNDGWGYEDLLPYFKRSERFELTGDTGYHGTDGPLNVARRGSTDELTSALIEAATEVGMERNEDYNGERQAGVGYYYSTVKDGERHSAAAAFIKPVLDRPNLTVEMDAHATSLALDGDWVSGVVYEQDGQEQDVSVNDSGDVVLSAGAIQSPQLLMLSGIGPADHLDTLGIDVAVDLPGVGRNLQDHLRVWVEYESPESFDLTDHADASLRYDRSLVGGFERSEPDLPAPDIQYGIAAGLSPEEPGGYSVSALPLRPESRGRLTLRSTDPYASPTLDPQYLSTEKDVVDIVTCLRRARDIAQADALAEFNGKERRPGPDVQTDAELEVYAKEIAVSGYHPVGTCKMGDDDLAVVDDRLRVHGVEGLRVVDASIMPTVTGGNTNAPTIAIAEKGADLIENKQ